MRWLAGDPTRRAELERAIARLESPEHVTWVRRRDTRRRLARVELDGGCRCFLKHYLRSTRHPWRERWKRWLHLSGAEREWRTLRRLRRAGVAVPEPLAHAQLASGEHVIATQWVDGVLLGEALAAARPAGRRALLEAVGALVRSLHLAGFAHRDLHRENVLIGAQGPLLIDLQAALPLAPRPARLRDLGELDASLRRQLSIGDRVRLRAAALGLARPFDRAARAQLRDVGRSSLARARAHARSRARRSLRAGRRAQAFDWLGGRGLISRTADAERVRAAFEHATPEPSLELRRYAGRWRDLWLGSAARRAWYVAHALEAFGVARPAPLAFLEWPPRAGRPGASALLVGAAPQAAPGAAERAEATTRLWSLLCEAGFDTARLDASGLRFERGADRLEACVWALERLRFPARPPPERQLVRTVTQR